MFLVRRIVGAVRGRSVGVGAVRAASGPDAGGVVAQPPVWRGGHDAVRRSIGQGRQDLCCLACQQGDTRAGVVGRRGRGVSAARGLFGALCLLGTNVGSARFMLPPIVGLVVAKRKLPQST